MSARHCTKCGAQVEIYDEGVEGYRPIDHMCRQSASDDVKPYTLAELDALEAFMTPDSPWRRLLATARAGLEATRRVEALRRFCDRHGGAHISLWANEMWEADDLWASDDPADETPAMVDSLDDLLDEMDSDNKETESSGREAGTANSGRPSTGAEE